MTADPVMRTYEGVIDSIRHMLLTESLTPP
jgi:hypothetical protein